MEMNKPVTNQGFSTRGVSMDSKSLTLAMQFVYFFSLKVVRKMAILEVLCTRTSTYVHRLCSSIETWLRNSERLLLRRTVDQLYLCSTTVGWDTRGGALNNLFYLGKTPKTSFFSWHEARKI